MLSLYADILSDVFDVCSAVFNRLLVLVTRLSLNYFELLKSDLFINRTTRIFVLFA
jgi:hypothetical protein